ncbi:acyl-CoA thioesterase [Pseudomonas benzenivorans]|uniref:Acyl-CoA thioesterase n=1 Tax=Pseudomonas benzenivorans TaxID=556533 RepID=A0ABY5H374_9PSED|nr:thioesterase family protein [Pseudomonas benzenivorans]UTW06504.1 acyl-CoA thioesterase [Pseudomonas benzenivorans]
MEPPFQLLLRVRYAECDAQQVVFNARYADYIDLAAGEFYRALLGSYRALLERGLDTQVVRLNIDWSASAHFDEVLELRVQTLRIGNSSYSLQVDILRHEDQRLLARGEVTYVMVDSTALHKVSVPDDLRELLQRGAPGVRIDQAG